jgi:hypothetical protein
LAVLFAIDIFIGRRFRYFEEIVERYPCTRAFLPVTRLRDGTLLDW